jgi:hypothetical protein
MTEPHPRGLTQWPMKQKAEARLAAAVDESGRFDAWRSVNKTVSIAYAILHLADVIERGFKDLKR